MVLPSPAMRWLRVALVLTVAGCIESSRPRFITDSAEDTIADAEDGATETSVDSTTAEAETRPAECFNSDDCVQPEDVCEVRVCDGNVCVLKEKVEGADCDDGDACTGDGKCREGICEEGLPVVDGKICDEDELVCNGIDTCEGGRCTIALPPECAPTDNPCAIDSVCSELTGGCVEVPEIDGKTCEGPADARNPGAWECNGGRCVPPDMVHVKTGTFWMGCPGESFCSDDNVPRHEVRISSFAIDRTEVSEAEFRACRDDSDNRGFKCDVRQNEGSDDVEAQEDDSPLRWIGWLGALEVCAYQGKRLCTEAEWEYAARGYDSDAFYPWGNLPPSCQRATFWDPPAGPGCDTNQPSLIGLKPAGASPFGALDMAGNVLEWCADYYRDDIYASRAGSTPVDPVQSVRDETEAHVIRGGSFRDGIGPLRVFVRSARGSEIYSEDLGVRCCLSLDDP